MQINCREFTWRINSIKGLRRELGVLISTREAKAGKKLEETLRAEIRELRGLSWPYEKLTTREIERHYLEQVEAMRAVELIYELPSGSEGVIGVDGKEYPLPSCEQVLDYLKDDLKFAEFLKVKEKQGFNKILIAPFAGDLGKMIDKVDAAVVGAGGKKALKSHSWIHKLPNLRYLFETDSLGNIVTGSGMTKSEILSFDEQQRFLLNGYAISVVENRDELPYGEEKEKVVGGRKVLGCGDSGAGYIRLFHDPESPYFGESSILPEEWFCCFAEALYKKHIKTGFNMVLGDIIINGRTRTIQAGCLNLGDTFLDSSWDSSNCGMIMDALIGHFGERLGVRPAVRKM